MNCGSGQQRTLGGQKIDFQRHVGVVQRAAVRRRELEARFFPVEMSVGTLALIVALPMRAWLDTTPSLDR